MQTVILFGNAEITHCTFNIFSSIFYLLSVWVTQFVVTQQPISLGESPITWAVEYTEAEIYTTSSGFKDSFKPTILNHNYTELRKLGINLNNGNWLKLSTQTAWEELKWGSVTEM